MARKPSLFVKLDAGMPENPKIEPLSDSAFRALVEAWCLCRRTGNDGQIPAAVWAKRWRPKPRKELVDAGLVVIVGEVVEIHDWLQWQPSEEELRSKSSARSEAGRQGGLRSGTVRQKRTKPEANASTETKQLLHESSSKTRSKPRTNREQEEEEDKELTYVSSLSHLPERASFDESESERTPTTVVVTSSFGHRPGNVPIPDDWAPTDLHRSKARQLNLDVDQAAEAFINHARATGRACADWSAAFHSWLASPKTRAMQQQPTDARGRPLATSDRKFAETQALKKGL